MLATMCKDYLHSQGIQVKLYHLYREIQKIDVLCKEIKEADTIVISGPCYINHYPADIIYLLEQIKLKVNQSNQKMYGIIQGGMPYIHTHESGVRTLQLFCKEVGISYQGSFIIGGGPILNGQPIEKLPNGKKVKKSYMQFLENIRDKRQSPDELYQNCQFKLPKVLGIILAKGMNRSIDKDLREKGINPYQISPYWEE